VMHDAVSLGFRAQSSTPKAFGVRVGK
jgi:hypothetical protein